MYQWSIFENSPKMNTFCVNEIHLFFSHFLLSLTHMSKLHSLKHSICMCKSFCLCVSVVSAQGWHDGAEMRLLVFHLHPLWIQPPHNVLIFFFFLQPTGQAAQTDKAQRQGVGSVFVLGGGSQIWGRRHGRLMSVSLDSGTAQHRISLQALYLWRSTLAHFWLCVVESVMGRGGLMGVSWAQLRPAPLFSQRWPAQQKPADTDGQRFDQSKASFTL